MADFVASDAEDDLQDFSAGGFLRHGGIEAGAALLDESEVEGCGVGDDLDEVGVIHVGVIAGDGPAIFDDYGLGVISAAEVGVGLAAIAGEPAGIDGEVEEIREASDAARSSGGTAFESLELVQIDGFSAF